MRPAGFRSPNPFIQPKKKSGSQKLGLDLENLEPSNNHNQGLLDIGRMLHFLRRELVIAEVNGKYSKAKKLRRAINQQLEAELYIRHSWCGGCQNVLHNCICRTN